MLSKIKKYLIVGICWRCGKCFCNKGISLGENNIVTINIVNSLSQPFLFFVQITSLLHLKDLLFASKE